MAMKDRRAKRLVPRTAIGAQLLVDGYVVGFAEVTDISVAGVGLATADGLPHGEGLEVRLETDEPFVPTFRASARVVWCRTAGSPERSRCGVCWGSNASIDEPPLKALIAATCRDQ
jgi:hypothetical protein